MKDRMVKIIFVKSADNDSNILTKKLSAELHQKHAKEMVIEKPWRLMLASKIFEAERKVVRDDVLTSNILKGKYFFD